MHVITRVAKLESDTSEVIAYEISCEIMYKVTSYSAWTSSYPVRNYLWSHISEEISDVILYRIIYELTSEVFYET